MGLKFRVEDFRFIVGLSIHCTSCEALQHDIGYPCLLIKAPIESFIWGIGFRELGLVCQVSGFSCGALNLLASERRAKTIRHNPEKPQTPRFRV